MSEGSSVLVRGRRLHDPAEVGPKFARQSELARHGVNVPPFFCLPAGCYTKVLRPHRAEILDRLARIDPTDPDSVAAHAGALRDLVTGIPFPDDLADRVLRAFDVAFGGDGVVSVRAAVVGRRADESEDSAADAFAGMSDSFLYVTRDRLLDRISHCWASAFNPESLLYRHARAGDGAVDWGFAVAVGVQRMVPGERSFVLFTADPTNGARDPVIAAGPGIGEGVVQERVPIDHYFVDRATGTVRTHTARPDARPVLAPAEVTELVALGNRIERVFGEPQDIEGTFTPDGRVHVLQSRPVVLTWPRQRLWSNANITESFPGVSTVLTYSFAQRFYRTIFADFYRLDGLDAAESRRREPELERMIGRLHGRIYYSLSAWYRLHRTSPLFPLWRGAWERMMGIDQTSPDGRYDVLAPTPTAGLRALAALPRWAWLTATHDRSMRDFETWWAALASNRRAPKLDPADPLTLVEDFHRVWGEVGGRWGRTLVNDLLLTTTSGVTNALFARWLPDDGSGLAADLLCGDEENHSVAALYSLVDLAERVRADPALRRSVEADPPGEVWRRMVEGGHGEALADRLRDHVDRYGDRGLQELKLERPNPRQRPDQLVRVIAEYAHQDVTVAGLRAQEAARRADGEHRLARRLARRPLRRLTLRLLLDRQRRYIRHRENSRYCRSELFGYAKRTFAALGVALAERGLLDDPADVVHLTQDEIFGYFDGTGTTENLRALAALRRDEHDKPGPELPMHFATMGTVPENWPTRVVADPTGSLHGIGSSGGRVRGTARVVLDPDNRPEPTDDMILVARETDPGWLFLMLSARGLVVERGTMLSHTAITGRKFGIPTVVAVPDATSRIPDGATIEMDGAQGWIRLVGEDA
ncbi:PEP/pyruvate-binding domain-containing protein [Micromonospora sp. NPDC050397]|uniref:PEP/pyruvate-binding domain-containing protein n=1 Tax=Micromonospora sp. NPDC050397 TaxID=3364279 RepID=UPI00384EC922